MGGCRSRKTLLIVAAVLYTGCFTLWTLAPTYPAFAAGFVLWGVSSAMVSGTYQAYVFDHLAARDQLAAYAYVIARGQSGGLILVLVATLLAAPLVALGGYPAVGWASVTVCVALIALALSLPADDTRSRRTSAATGLDTYRLMLRTGLRQSVAVPRIRHAVLLAAIFPGFLAFDEYFPLLAGELGTTTSHIPLLIAITVAAQAAGAALAPHLPARGTWPSVAVAGIAIMGGAVSGRAAGFALIAIGYGALQMVIVVVETRLQHVIVGEARATVTSVAGLLSEIAAITVYSGFALGSYTWDLPELVALLAGVLTASALLVRR